MAGVMVYLDGRPLVVPEVAGCHYAARGALGLARGLAVKLTSCPANPADPNVGERLTFTDGWRFRGGDCYAIVDGLSIFEPEPNASPGEMKPWERDPDWWRR